jgi:plastocyanin domain-containing protein
MRLATLLTLTLLAPLARPVAAADEPRKARVVEIAVTEDGFEPAEVKVKKGEPLELVVTRKTDRTCAREIVVKGYGVNRKLPLGKAVTVKLTPRKTGTVRYACSMDMVAGELLVE